MQIHTTLTIKAHHNQALYMSPYMSTLHVRQILPKSEEMLPNPFYEASITLILKPGNDVTHKKKTMDQYPYSLDTKPVSIVLAN